MVKAPPPRDYQLQAANEIREAFKAGSKSVLAVLPTGMGKTTVFALIAQLAVAAGSRAYFVAHRTELVAQGRERAELFGLSVGEISAQAWKHHGRPVQAAMLLTLINRLPELKPHEAFGPRTLVFIDEAHRAVSASYAKIIEAAKAAGARIIGLTATPWRTDKKPMGLQFDSMVAPIGISEAIERGFLLRPKYYAPQADVDNIKMKGNDYDTDDMFRRFNKRALYSGVVTNYRNFGENRPCVCYCINVEHSEKTAQAFQEEGISAVHVDGETPPGLRKQILLDFKAGKYQVLCNADLFTEGLDVPSIGVCIINRKTASLALYIQMVGRGARPIAGQTEANDEARVAAIAASHKPNFVVLDMGQNLKTHGFWEDEREYTLEAPEKKRKGLTVGTVPVKSCPSCGEMQHAGRRSCQGCGYEWPDERGKTEEAVFVEITRVGGLSFLPPTVKKRQRFKALPPELETVSPWQWSQEQWVQVRRLCSYKPGWESHQLEYKVNYLGQGKEVAA